MFCLSVHAGVSPLSTFTGSPYLPRVLPFPLATSWPWHWAYGQRGYHGPSQHQSSESWGSMYWGALKARPWCKVPRSEIPSVAISPTRHMHPHARICVHNYTCTPMYVCTCICINTMCTPHACTHTSTCLHTGAQLHTHAHTHLCTYPMHDVQHTCTHHRESVSSHQHVTSCHSCVGLKSPEAGSPGRAHPISDLQSVKRAGQGYAHHSSALVPLWGVGTSKCSCSDRAGLCKQLSYLREQPQEGAF